MIANNTTLLRIDPQTNRPVASLTFKEEIYQLKNFDPKQVHVILGLDMEKTKDPKRTQFIPIAYCKQLGKGRTIEAPEPQEEPEPVPDLMAALEESLASARKKSRSNGRSRSRGGGGKKKSRAKAKS